MHDLFQLLIVQPIFNALMLLYSIIPWHDFGLAIIIFTIILRFVMWRHRDPPPGLRRRDQRRGDPAQPVPRRSRSRDAAHRRHAARGRRHGLGDRAQRDVPAGGPGRSGLTNSEY